MPDPVATITALGQNTAARMGDIITSGADRQASLVMELAHAQAQGDIAKANIYSGMLQQVGQIPQQINSLTDLQQQRKMRTAQIGLLQGETAKNLAVAQKQQQDQKTLKLYSIVTQGTDLSDQQIATRTKELGISPEDLGPVLPHIQDARQKAVEYATKLSTLTKDQQTIQEKEMKDVTDALYPVVNISPGTTPKQYAALWASAVAIAKQNGITVSPIPNEDDLNKMSAIVTSHMGISKLIAEQKPTLVPPGTGVLRPGETTPSYSQPFKPPEEPQLLPGRDVPLPTDVEAQKIKIANATKQPPQGSWQPLIQGGKTVYFNTTTGETKDAPEGTTTSAQETANRKWVSWTENGKQVAGPLSMAQSHGASDAVEVPAQEVRDITNARFAANLMTKVGDPKKIETNGVLQLIDSLDKDGKLGVLASRYNSFLTKGVGASPGDDPRIITLINKNMLSDTATMLAHFGASGGRSPAMLQHFIDLANSGKMDAQTLKAGTLAIADYMKDRAMLPGNQQGGPSKAAPQVTIDSNGSVTISPGR